MKLQIDNQIASHKIFLSYMERIYRKLPIKQREDLLCIEQVFNPIYYDLEWISSHYHSLNVMEISKFTLTANALFDSLLDALTQGTTIDPVYLQCQHRYFTTLYLVIVLSLAKTIEEHIDDSISNISFWGAEEAAEIVKSIARKNGLKYKRRIKWLHILIILNSLVKLVIRWNPESFLHCKLVRVRNVGKNRPNIFIFADRDTGLTNGIELAVGIEGYNVWAGTRIPESYDFLEKYETIRIWKQAQIPYHFQKKAAYKNEIDRAGESFRNEGLSSQLNPLIKSGFSRLSLIHTQKIIFDEIFKIVKPDVIFVDDSISLHRRLLTLIANRLDIPVIQTGESGYSEETILSLAANNIFINQYKIYTRYLSSFLKGKNLIVASSPRYNDFWRLKSSMNPQAAKAKLGVPPDKRLIVFCGSPGTGPRMLLNKVKYEHLMLQSLNLRPQERLIMKLHPQDDGRITRRLVKNLGVDNVTVLQDYPFNSLLEACDLFLGTNSTSNIDIGILGKPVILIDFDDTGYHRRLTDNQLIWRCTAAYGLRKLVDEVFSRKVYPQNKFFEKIVKPEEGNFTNVEKLKHIIADMY